MNEQTAISGSLALNSAPHVIMIPASGPVRTRKLRVAAYARVSSNSEDQIHSFAAQNAYFSKLITDNPDWELADIYADQGITGTSTKKRAAFNRMIHDAYMGKFQLIITKEVSRFSRNILDTISFTRELKEIGVWHVEF